VSVRWIWLDAEPGHANYASLLDPERAGILGGKTTFLFDREAGPYGVLRTYVPVAVDPDRPGALELEESLEDEAEKVRAVVGRALTMTLAIVGVYAFIALACGLWFVGKPVRALMEKARRIGDGDFGTPLALRSRDELADLARELNSMAGSLAAAEERLRAETEARIATMEQLRHADRLATVGKLASGVAHELGTPLNVIMARAKMIHSRPAIDEASKGNAAIVGEQASRMAAIIRLLLDFARPRVPKKTTVDLRSLVRETVDLLSPIGLKTRVSLEIEAEGEPIPARVDPGQIQQVLSNLVVNGIQASPQGASLRIEVGKARATPPPWHEGPEGDYLRIAVRDGGCGIPPEHIPHIFEPFFTTKGVGEGTGLGLPVALGIVREHGGWIAVSSSVGVGSSFSIHLPIESGSCAAGC
jgi:signal transduction histidine kinase